jgi:hypothetical protein
VTEGLNFYISETNFKFEYVRYGMKRLGQVGFVLWAI